MAQRFKLISREHLHGSTNWVVNENDPPLMVIGTGKTQQIQKIPLLHWYNEIFQNVLNDGNVCLMVIGYGFSDVHINQVIANAINNHDLRVLIWDSGDVVSLRARLFEKKFGEQIWNGLLMPFTRLISDVFPTNIAASETIKNDLFKKFFD